MSTAERVQHPTRKRADFLPRSLVTRKLDKPSRERRQMTAGFGLAGALFCAAKTGTHKLEKRSCAAQGGIKRVS